MSRDKKYPRTIESKNSYLRIRAPEHLDVALEGLIRKVLKEQPKMDDIYQFAADYFDMLLKIREKAGIRKLSVQDICPHHNEEDAHEMIKLASKFSKRPKEFKPKTRTYQTLSVRDHIKHRKHSDCMKSKDVDLRNETLSTVTEEPKQKESEQKENVKDKENTEPTTESYLLKLPIQEEEIILKAKEIIPDENQDEEESPRDTLQSIGNVGDINELKDKIKEVENEIEQLGKKETKDINESITETEEPKQLNTDDKVTKEGSKEDDISTEQGTIENDAQEKLHAESSEIQNTELSNDVANLGHEESTENSGKQDPETNANAESDIKTNSETTKTEEIKHNVDELQTEEKTEIVTEESVEGSEKQDADANANAESQDIKTDSETVEILANEESNQNENVLQTEEKSEIVTEDSKEADEKPEDNSAEIKSAEVEELDKTNDTEKTVEKAEEMVANIEEAEKTTESPEESKGNVQDTVISTDITEKVNEGSEKTEETFDEASQPLSETETKNEISEKSDENTGNISVDGIASEKNESLEKEENLKETLPSVPEGDVTNESPGNIEEKVEKTTVDIDNEGTNENSEKTEEKIEESVTTSAVTEETKENQENDEKVTVEESGNESSQKTAEDTEVKTDLPDNSEKEEESPVDTADVQKPDENSTEPMENAEETISSTDKIDETVDVEAETLLSTSSREEPQTDEGTKTLDSDIEKEETKPNSEGEVKDTQLDSTEIQNESKPEGDELKENNAEDSETVGQTDAEDGGNIKELKQEEPKEIQSSDTEETVQIKMDETESKNENVTDNEEANKTEEEETSRSLDPSIEKEVELMGKNDVKDENEVSGEFIEIEKNEAEIKTETPAEDETPDVVSAPERQDVEDEKKVTGEVDSGVIIGSAIAGSALALGLKEAVDRSEVKPTEEDKLLSANGTKPEAVCTEVVQKFLDREREYSGYDKSSVIEESDKSMEPIVPRMAVPMDEINKNETDQEEDLEKDTSTTSDEIEFDISPVRDADDQANDAKVEPKIIVNKEESEDRTSENKEAGEQKMGLLEVPEPILDEYPRRQEGESDRKKRSVDDVVVDNGEEDGMIMECGNVGNEIIQKGHVQKVELVEGDEDILKVHLTTTIETEHYDGDRIHVEMTSRIEPEFEVSVQTKVESPVPDGDKLKMVRAAVVIQNGYRRFKKRKDAVEPQPNDSDRTTIDEDRSKRNNEIGPSDKAADVKRTLSRRATRNLLETHSLDPIRKISPLKTRSLSTVRYGVADFEIWNKLVQELEQAATKIQSNYRGYKTRKKLKRENAVQSMTASEDSTTADYSQRHTGEFHDSIVLVLSPK